MGYKANWQKYFVPTVPILKVFRNKSIYLQLHLFRKLILVQGGAERKNKEYPSLTIGYTFKDLVYSFVLFWVNEEKLRAYVFTNEEREKYGQRKCENSNTSFVTITSDQDNRGFD